jgi:hypothetical protein
MITRKMMYIEIAPVNVLFVEPPGLPIVNNTVAFEFQLPGHQTPRTTSSDVTSIVTAAVTMCTIKIVSRLLCVLGAKSE